MEEIEVGEYVRASYGEIGTYLGIDLKFKMYDYDVNDNKSSCKYNELSKHSKNLIDLIEVGDYVNGYKVRGKTNEKVVVDYYCYSEELAGGNWLTFYKDNIQSIVTKEQFASMEYKIQN